MKSLKNYILESIKHLPNSKKGIIVFDIDDTLLVSDPSLIHIYKHPGGDKKKEIILSTAEFAKDPDSLDPAKKSWFDYRDFSDPIKIRKSIIEGTPIIRNLKILDAYVNAGYEFSFLTARQQEKVIKKAMAEFLMVRKNNVLRHIGSDFNITLSAAVNDLEKKYPGITDAEKKANVLKKICKRYDKVIFVDDDDKNINDARALNLPNLKVIKAWKD